MLNRLAFLILYGVVANSCSDDVVNTSLDKRGFSKEELFMLNAPVLEGQRNGYWLANEGGLFSATLPVAIFDACPNPTDWPTLDSLVREEILKSQLAGGPSTRVQYLSCRFLDQYLLQVPTTPQSRQAVSYYLGLLIAENNRDWLVLTSAMDALMAYEKPESYEAFCQYFASQTQAHILANQSKIKQYKVKLGASESDIQRQVLKNGITYLRKRNREAKKANKLFGGN